MASTSAHKPRSSKVNKGKGYHSKNNAVAWQEHQLAHGQRKKGAMGKIKEEKAPHSCNAQPKEEMRCKE